MTREPDANINVAVPAAVQMNATARPAVVALPVYGATDE